MKKNKVVKKNRLNKVIYNKDFYLELSERAGTKRAAEIVVPLLLNILRENGLLKDKPRIADFGCGPGIWLNEFKNHGCSIHGYDGGSYKNYYYIASDEFSNVDLTKRIEIEKKYDIAVSLEVAEHIVAEKLNAFLDNITKASDFILFSAAIPLQLGQGHVNEQWPSYWVEVFKKRGFACLDIIRPEIWEGHYDMDFFYQQNVLLFVKECQYTREFIKCNRRPVYDLVHPRQWEKIHTWIPVKAVVALYNNPFTYRIFEKWKKFKRHYCKK